ncbi:MAG TPA: Lrp/AsnC ligand binding domain-containing protein [Chitinophagales bacterium]|nr:Lrp/AsnC ligand binding domain-containing protein [Chitinophagales bacterium]
MPENYQIDKTDLQILSYLTQDAMMPYTEIAKKIFVSSGTVHVRMNKLQKLGIVKGSQVQINYAKLGYDVKAFLGIYLEKNSLYDKVAAQLKKIPEITELNYTTGNYSMFVKILCRDTQHLREVLHDKIQKINGIERTETFISLEESINRSVQLVEDDKDSKPKGRLK